MGEPWMDAAVSVGTATGGTGVLLFALKSSIPSLAKWLASRARADEVTAETVQSIVDEMRGRVERINDEAKKRNEEHKVELAECENGRLALERQLRALHQEYERLRDAVAAMRPSIPVPGGTPALPPTARLEVVMKGEGDKR